MSVTANYQNLKSQILGLASIAEQAGLSFT